MPLTTNDYGKTLTFETVSPAILGSKIVNAKLQSIVDPATAKALGIIDITYQHLLVFNDLPPGTKDDPMSYNYAKFLMPDGSPALFGMPWIKEGSVVEVVVTDLVVRIKNVGHDTISIVRNALISNGITSGFTIDVES